MPFPTNLDQLRDAGYRHENCARCRACKVSIEFWRTPLGKIIPLEIDDKGKVTPHFANCPEASQFRKARA